MIKRAVSRTGKPSEGRTATTDTSMGNASKPLSLHPLKTDEALAALLKVKPPIKPEK